MDHHTFLTWSLCLAFICSAGSLSQASYTSGHGSKARDQQVTQTGQGGQHKGHGHSALGKKDELEEELLKLKGSTNEDTGFTSLRDPSRGGQPEFTNEDLEEELTEVRPLDIPLHLLQVDTLEDQNQDRYATSTMRAFGELDSGGLTTVSSRLSELQIREELEADFRSDTDFGDWDQDDDDFKTEEANHSGDHSGDKWNLSPPHVSTTEQYNAVDIDKKGKQKVKLSDDEDDDDDDDESDEADDESDDGDDDEDDESDDDDDEDDDDDDGDGDGDGDGDDDDDDEDENSEGEKEDKKQTLAIKKSVGTVKPNNFEDSVEHGRQWKQTEEVEESQEAKETSTPDREEWSPLTTSTPETSRGALERDLATLLRNGSPEMEEHESRNASEEAIEEGENNESRHKESEEAEFDTVHKLEQVRELEKKANIPEKLVDSVSPKADEDLLELMVRIAENPAEWQRVHNVLQQLDQDLVSSRKSLEEVKSLQKSSHRTEKKKDGEDAINALSNKTEVTKEHRKHQQGEKKKKKKKKQRQKEKLKNKAEKEKAKLKGKGKEEIRREELEKAGVLPPSNSLLKGNEKGKTSKGSIETSKTKSYWTKSSSSKDSTHTKIKGNSLPFVDPGKNSNVKQKEILPPTADSKEIKYKDLSNSNYNRKGGNDRMASIDSAISYLSEPKQSLDDINKLPDTNKNNKLRHYSNWAKADDIDNRIEDSDDSWPTNEDVLSNKNNKNNKNKWYGTVSHSRLNKDIDSPRRNPNLWDKQITGSGISIFRELDRNDLIGTPQYSAPNKEGATYSWKNSRTNLKNWPDSSKTNPKEERRYYSGEPVYNSPNTGWPQFSVESLKHGNLAGNIKSWPDLPIDQSLGSNKDYNTLDRTPDWPNLPLRTSVSKTKGPSIYTWPNYSDNNTKQNSIITGKINSWSKPNLESAESKQREIMANTWSQMPQQQKPSVIDSAIAHHSKEPANNKQWPHFAYHRVTSSPQILAQQQKEAQQRARHRNAYIAVSVIAPPGKNKGLNKSQSKNNSTAVGSSQSLKNKTSEAPVKPSVSPLPDKMDQLLTMRSDDKKFPDGDILEEQLVDMVVAGEQQQRYGEQDRIPWSHARHLDKIQEQLKTLSAMGEKLRYHWLEKERLLQILRDGGKSGSSFYRTQRDGSRRQESEATTSSTTISSTTNSPSLLTTTHHPVSP